MSRRRGTDRAYRAAYTRWRDAGAPDPEGARGHGRLPCLRLDRRRPRRSGRAAAARGETRRPPRSERRMESLTRLVLRRRWVVLAIWLVILLAAGWASSGLSDLLTNRFTLPGSDTAKAEAILEDHFGQKSTGSFTVVVRAEGRARRDPPAGARRRRPAPRRAADEPRRLGRAGERRRGRRDDRLGPCARRTPRATRTRCGPRSERSPGADVYLTGQAATEHDLDPVFERGSAARRVLHRPSDRAPAADPHVRDARLPAPVRVRSLHDPDHARAVWIVANFMELTTYLTNMVSLIGLGIAIDYSLLIVYRFREELPQAGRPRRGDRAHDGHGRARRRLQRHGRRDRTGAAALHAAAVHARLRDRRAAHPERLRASPRSPCCPRCSPWSARGSTGVRLLPKRVLERRASYERGFWPSLARRIMRRPALVRRRLGRRCSSR